MWFPSKLRAKRYGDTEGLALRKLNAKTFLCISAFFDNIPGTVSVKSMLLPSSSAISYTVLNKEIQITLRAYAIF